MVNIAVFASGKGSNAVNLVKTFNTGSRIRVALCLTDKEEAPVVEKMRELGVPTYYFPRNEWKDDPRSIIETLRNHDIKIIVLAGFLCYVNSEIINEYEGRILNIHPSLLPAYGGQGMHGMNVHRAVIEAGEATSGATVHIVTEDLDNGPIVIQREVSVLPDDTPESLAEKIHKIEYQILPEAIVQIMKSLEPPAIPQSVDDDWAQVLGVPNNVPPVPTEAGLTSQASDAETGAQLQEKPWMRNRPQTAAVKNRQPMPPTWLVWSVVCTVLCCTVPGIIAIYNSAKVSSRYYAGDIEGAQRSSRNTEIWIIISFVLGVIGNTLYIPLTIAGFL